MTSYAYDEVGNRITQTDANTHATSYAYDQRGRRLQRTLPLGQTESYTYDAVGNLATRTDFNDADVTFLQMMYPHHAQAVEMAQLVPGRSQNQEVLTLAAKIENAQAPEMAQMSALLTSFGKPAPTPDGGHMTAMPGMMAPDQMNTLKGLSGKEFDRMWLQMMIHHHTGVDARYGVSSPLWDWVFGTLGGEAGSR